MICRSSDNAERRVLTVIRWPLGGIRTYLLYNYPSLIKAGYRFTLVGPADASFRRLYDELKDWPGVEFVDAPVRGKKCDLRETVRGVLRQHRFRLIHSQGLTAGVQAVLANLGHGVPHIITSHDVLRPDQFRGLSGRMKLVALRWLVNRADTLVAVSRDAERNHLEFLGQPRRRGCRILTILNGIETGRFIETDRFNGECSPAERTLRARLEIAHDAYVIGFLGRFMEQKGFLVLVDAIERALATPGAERIHLLAVGSGDYVREYRATIDSHPELARRTTFLDHTANVRPLLNEIDLLVMPSLWEACPLLPMEAMCAGVPVLGSDCIGLREVLSGSPSMTVPAGDATALAQGIRQAVLAPWTEKAVQYAPVARQRFDVRQSAEQLQTLFDRSMT